MNPISLKLTGFKGIKSGLGLDEIYLDFTKLPSGIIVFDASNGKGKTTIMDNMTPYRFMPYRASSMTPNGFSFYDHIEACPATPKGVARDCEASKEFIFEMEGEIYKTVLLLSRQKKKQEAYIYHLKDDSFLPLNPDGRVDTYDKMVDEIMGSPELFFASVFRCQNARSLSDYTKGELKDILSELLGLERLKTISEKAHEVKKGIAALTSLKEQEVNRLRVVKEKRQETEQHLGMVKKAIASIETSLMGMTEKKDALTDKKAGKDKLIALSEEKAKRARSLENEIKVREKEIRDLQQKLENALQTLKKRKEEKQQKFLFYQEIIEQEGFYRKEVAALEAETANLNELKQAKGIKEKELEGLLDSLSETQKNRTQIATLEVELQKLTNTRILELARLRTEKDETEKAAKMLTLAPCGSELIERCPFAKNTVGKKNHLSQVLQQMEGYAMPSEREKTLKESIATLEGKLPMTQSLQAEAENIRQAIRLLNGKIASAEKAIENKRDYIVKLATVDTAKASVIDLTEEIASFEKQSNDTCIETLNGVKDIAEKISSLRKELSSFVFEGIDALVFEVGQIASEIENIRNEINRLIGQKAEAERQIGRLEAERLTIANAEKEFTELTHKIKFLKKEQSSYALLEKAFGNDGIIALEIDDAGPSISATANELLAVFGGRFSIRIDTQSVKSDGKNMKESLEIIVYDAEGNELKNLRRMSGGERTWIEDAITKAIAIVRQESSGRRYKTIFTDEKDGALDAEKKVEYFAMKRKVLEIGGYNREFCITQTPELKELADARIILAEGKVIIS